MMIDQIHRFVIPAAYALLPPNMNRPPATAMLLAIGMQESRFEYRRQVGGPAHGFWQFERDGATKGVMQHPVTAGHVQRALKELRYVEAIGSPTSVYNLIVDNDTLAAVLARLLLWTVPGRLPTIHEPELGWDQYIAGWQPGKPHHETWNTFFSEAWRIVSLMPIPS